MTTQIESSMNTTSSSNMGYNSAPSLKIRLDTTEVRENIEMYLKGETLATFRDEESGRIYERRISTDNKKANEKGIHAILNYVQSIINPQVVQGNFPSDQEGKSEMYDKYIEEVNLDLLLMVQSNLYNWDIDEDDANEIIDFIMKLVIPFMTRLIDNKERDSYDNTVRHSESSQVSEGKRGGLLSFFG